MPAQIAQQHRFAIPAAQGQEFLVHRVDDSLPRGFVQHRWPIEVKAGENRQAKSLKVYREKFAPAISLRTSLADFRRESWLCNVPLYAVGAFLANPARP